MVLFKNLLHCVIKVWENVILPVEDDTYLHDLLHLFPLADFDADYTGMYDFCICCHG